MALSIQPHKLNEILKLNRDRKRASLQTAQQDTRISVDYLQALETGEYGKFPAEVYCIGFLKKYAAYLGLNPEEMVALYKKEQEARMAAHIETEKKQLDHEKQEKSTDLVKVLTLIILLVFVGGGWLFTVLRSTSENKASEPLSIAQRAMVPVLPVPHRSLTLAAFTRDNVWMRVVPDKQLSFEGFVAAGSTRTWEAQVEIFIRIGNVEAVSLTLNGQPI